MLSAMYILQLGFNTSNTFSTLANAMAKPRKNNVTTRNIVLKIGTYDRLQKFLVQLVREREIPRISFDDAINELLDRAERQ